jgi:hypothetical protein
MAGSISTLTLGAIKDAVDDPTKDSVENARIDGYVLMGGVLFSYFTCGPLFLISGRSYAKQLAKLKGEIAASVIEDQEIEANAAGQSKGTK